MAVFRLLMLTKSNSMGADLIIVTGASGAGKSSFIQCITGRDIYVSSGHESATAKTALVPAVINGKKYLFLDMPGFSASDRDDFDTFRMLVTAMATVQCYVRFRGVIYVDSLKEDRLQNYRALNFGWLSCFCGENYMPNVTIVSTCWDGLDEEGIAEKLKRFENFRAEALGGRFFRHGAKEFQHGRVVEDGKSKTLSMKKKGNERAYHAQRMIHEHYGEDSDLKLKIYVEIEDGCPLEYTTAGRWLREGGVNPGLSGASAEYSPEPEIHDGGSPSSGNAGTKSNQQDTGSRNNTRSTGNAPPNQGFWAGLGPKDALPWVQLLIRAAYVFRKSSVPSFSSQPGWFDDQNSFDDSESFFSRWSSDSSSMPSETPGSTKNSSWQCAVM
ncbi:hypothetical protein BS50DRAFT_566969 [Corynespora cassiicola Philippines]|uniref:G domain-containing protein n=1 Tax=Corynespora cassiicola Philippines TaxID=1448308 RepID=A0A2T2P8T7_CORCC|nr:hypothetical protein BS50DRAFT_566969 [Corynespora cassiicola Philippines]